MNERVTSQIVLGVLGLTAVGAGAAASIWGLPAFFLGLAAGALSLVIVLMWGSLQQMSEEGEMGFEQAMSYAAPLAEEEQKRALLRTLKDLEYELSVGKISRTDYDQISADIRDKAKRVIALTDETMKDRIHAAQQRIEEHAKKVAKTGASSMKSRSKEPEPKPEPELEPTAPDQTDSDPLPDQTSEEEAK